MLLVGGDSFAQFPRFHWYKTSPAADQITTVSYPASKRGPGFTVDYTYPHWCEILDNNAISVGIGGGDIYTTSFVTTQSILSNPKITHCIFFITGFDRDVIQTTKRTFDKLKLDILDTPPMKEVYTSKSKYVVDGHLSRRHEPESNFRLVGHNWFCESEEMRGPNADEILNHLSYTPAFKQIHTKLACLSHLKTICDNNDVKILFTTPMDGETLYKQLERLLNITCFDFHPAIANHDEWILTNQYKWLTSHLTKEQHVLVADRFKSQFPNWLDK